MASQDRKRDVSASTAAKTPPPPEHKAPPPAGAHAASHLVNEDATPGSGILTTGPHVGGREVDSGAG